MWNSILCGINLHGLETYILSYILFISTTASLYCLHNSWIIHQLFAIAYQTWQFPSSHFVVTGSQEKNMLLGHCWTATCCWWTMFWMVGLLELAFLTSCLAFAYQSCNTDKWIVVVVHWDKSLASRHSIATWQWLILRIKLSFHHVSDLKNFTWRQLKLSLKFWASNKIFNLLHYLPPKRKVAHLIWHQTTHHKISIH